MEFTGAVLVCNKKITSAIENYRKTEKEWDDIWKPVVLRLNKEYGKLSWWKKMWHDGSAFGLWKWQYVLCVKHNAKNVTCKWDRVEKNLLDGGVITQGTYDKFKIYFNTYDYCDTLETLSICGEPVYLNTQQAAFVNRFYKGE